MQKLIVLTIGILLIAGGYLLWQQQGKTTSTPDQMQAEPTQTESMNEGTESASMEKTETSEVMLSDSGFAPATITVKKGTTVTFTNNSGGSMWVASAPHPTHSIYPQFDQKTAVGKGQMYQFTFDKVGSWKYHNHMDASQFGTVVVE